MNQLVNVDVYQSEQRPVPLLTRIALFPLSIIILCVGITWRVVDIFVLGLGSTALNILPSKIIPLSILLGIFWLYRKSEIGPILGLSRNHIRAHIIIGIILGISFYLGGVVVPTFIYWAFNGSFSALAFHVPLADILWYEFLFVFINAVMEETLFRGILYHGFRSRTTINKSILLAAVVFGLWHILWPFANGKTGSALLSDIFVSVVFSGILGAFFAVYYVRFTSATALTGPIVAHTLVNFLNESLKIGDASGIQGPDTPSNSPFQIILSGIFFLITISILSFVLYRYKFEVILSRFSRFSRSL